jgi:hypothetical protein
MSLAPDKIGGQIVKPEEYKQILLVKEKEMLQQMGREGADARESSDEEVHSWGVFHPSPKPLKNPPIPPNAVPELVDFPWFFVLLGSIWGPAV